MSKCKILKSKKINKNTASVVLEMDGKIYSDTFSIVGKKKILERIDKDSDTYKINNAMYNAIVSKTKKEDENGKHSEADSG